MSARPIRVGDLVQVVRPRVCGCAGYMGSIFVVTRLCAPAPGGNFCSVCLDYAIPVGLCALGARSVVLGSKAAISTSRLRRIPPLSELEGASTEEVLRVPSTKEAA